MHGRRTAVLTGAFALVLTGVGVAAAAPVSDYEMPFPCGQAWAGTTRDAHSPSPYAVDWNRADDVDDPVVASAAGTVTVADKVADSGYGRWVRIDHGNNETTLYAHMNTVTVAVGQRVDQGMQIGTVGSTGNSSGPHLHYEQRYGSSVMAAWFHQKAYTYGTTLTSQNCVDVPLTGDWNKDLLAEPTVYRRAATSEFRWLRPDGTTAVRKLGTSTDEPVAGDWDGNGNTNPGIRTPATSTFTMRTPAGTTTLVYGVTSDRPVSGNWGGTPAWEIGVHRPSIASFLLRMADGTTQTVKLGDANDLPVTGDWDADGVTDLGVYDQATSTFSLRKVDAEGVVWIGTVTFGSPGDLPVTGDWDANRRTDLGVWSPATGVFTKRIATTPAGTMRSTSTVKFGRAR